MKVLFATPGQCITATAKEALTKGYSHIFHNERVYEVDVAFMEIDTLNELKPWLKTAQWQVRAVEVTT